MVSRLTTDRVVVEDRVLGRQGLSPRMRAASYAVAETLFTTRHGPPPAARLEWLCDDLDDFLQHAGPRARLVYRSCILAVSRYAPLLVRRPVAFSKLSPELRTEALEKMERGAGGLAVFGAKALLCFIYYEHPDAAAEIGFDASCLNDP